MAKVSQPAACVIRLASRDEIPEITSLYSAAFAEVREHVPQALFDGYIKSLHNLADIWDEAEVFVAQLDGQLAGSVSFYADASAEGLGLPKNWAGFRKLAVHPKMRGHGIGSLLTENCVERARMLGISTIGLHTASFLQAACRIYEQIGFRRCPEYDRPASVVTDSEVDAGGIVIIAYKLDPTPVAS